MIVSLIDDLRDVTCVVMEGVEESVELSSYFGGRISVVGVEDNDTFMLRELGAIPPTCLSGLDQRSMIKVRINSLEKRIEGEERICFDGLCAQL